MPNQHTKKVTTVGKAPKPKVEYVTQGQLDAFENRIVDTLEKLLAPKQAVGPNATAVMTATPAGDTSTFTVPQTQVEAVTETPIEREIRKAGPSEVPMNPEWEEMARDIIGEAVDHCEIAYLKNGGVLFTVVIKTAFSNATPDYLTYYHSDRRSKEIGHDGVSGVEEWCKLIKSNLARNK